MVICKEEKSGYNDHLLKVINFTQRFDHYKWFPLYAARKETKTHYYGNNGTHTHTSKWGILQLPHKNPLQF